MSSRERIQKALDSLLYLPHLQAQHRDEPSLPVASTSPPGGGATGKGRPWDRGDLFRRLATFRSSTWFCKPAAISPVECARRGWTNTAADLLSCEFCKAKVSCPIPADLLPEQAVAAAERYASKLTEAHDAACPWRTSTSSLSLLQFPPLTAEAVKRDFEARYAALQRLACLPPVAPEQYEAVAAAVGKRRLHQLLRHTSDGSPPQQQQERQQQPSPTMAGAAAAAAAARGQEAVGSESPADAATDVDLGEGAAVLGTTEFEARARLLALCGWDLKLLTPAAPALPAAAEPGSADSDGTEGQMQASAAAQQQQRQPQQQQQQQQQGEELPALVGPESAALLCSLCNAKAGLWTFFPQCKPVVLAPARRLQGAGAVQSPSAAVTRTVSRNVAADNGTTIAGGAMQTAGGGVATSAPFGAGARQPAVFGLGGSPADDSSASNGAGLGQQPGKATDAAPFGSGSRSASVPVFGFAALQAGAPAAVEVATGAQAGVAAGRSGSLKRKEPDFSWEAVIADINAKAAAEKRSKAAAAGGTGLVGTAGNAAAGAAKSPNSSARPGGQQQQAAAVVMAGKYRGAQVAPLDPLALHRPFCPWVNCTQAGEKDGRCGWRWCVQQLVAPLALAENSADLAGAVNGGEADGDGSRARKEWDPAGLLRSVLQQVDVHK